jgi:hypothetical protein
MNTTPQLVARALRDHQTIATTDNSLGHRFKLTGSRAQLLAYVRALPTAQHRYITLYPTPRTPPSGLGHYVKAPPPPPPPLEAARQTPPDNRERAIYHAQQLAAILEANGTTDIHLALLQLLHINPIQTPKAPLQ